MRPQEANPANFEIQEIIHEDPNQGFAIAVGTWKDDGTTRLAMRWTGRFDDPNDRGYPSVRGNAMWFQLPVEMDGVIRTLNENLNGIARP